MFFLKSLVFTIFSPKFYKEALDKGPKKAWGVYALFSVLITLVIFLYFAIDMGISLYKMPDEIEDFPEISYENNELTVESDKPLEFIEGGQYIGVDTTGQLQEIPVGYNEGFLITKDSMIIRSEDARGDQVIEYSQLEIDSFSLDEEKVESLISTLGIAVILVSPFVIFLAEFVGRLISVFLISLLGLIVLSIMKQKDSFKKSFFIAMYASIPVFYLNLLSKLFNWATQELFDFTVGSICCLVPIIIWVVKWGIFWGIGAYGVKESSE
ncbi:DUF1189 family protein [Candidatus Dojkabacteria bacterium]|nr:DUF1189 family protein [Candidatus Dojkabacteria bacterium]